MTEFIDIYKKIIKYNFVTLISANIYQLHFHLHLHLHFQGSFYHHLLLKISFPVTPYYIKTSYNSTTLTASRITNSQTQSFSIYIVKFFKSRHNCHKNDV